MRDYVYCVGLVVTVACFASANAQAPTVSQSKGQDYFTAENGPTSYLRILEGEHVNKFSNKLREGQKNEVGQTTVVWGDILYTLDRFPNHPQALQQLSLIAQIRKETSVAASYFEKAITLFPQYALTRAQYGMFLLSINNVDAGIERFNQSIEIDPKFSAGYAGLAHAYSKKGNIAKARESAAKARELGFNGKLPDGL